MVTALEHLPPRTQLAPDAIQERYREKEIARRRLAAVVNACGEIRDALAATLVEFNGHRGEPASFDLLEGFLDQQPYRLCYWRVATDEINYRRFFDVNELAAIRVEDPEVFRAVHEKVFQFLDRGWVTGLRIDHADGLLDPQAYLENLRRGGPDPAASAAEPAVELAVAEQPAPYLVVEKILGPHESLNKDWPVQGTTGYGFLNLLNGLFVDRRGLGQLRQTYTRFTDQPDAFAQVLFDCKRTILATSLSSELYVLSNQLMRIADQHRWSRNFTRPSLYRALRDVVVCFQVYRTYIRPGIDVVRDEDRRRIVEAVRAARRRNAAMSASFFDFIASVLLLDDPAGLSDAHRAERREFVLKLQQITSPVAAKGLEDTAFYRFYPLASLNEVGGDLGSPPAAPEQFHQRLIAQQAAWPDDMLATGTHDTKRGEDFRARLNVLSECPDAWDAAIHRWREANAPLRHDSDGQPVPDPNEEYLIYQTLVGTWPGEAPDEAARAEYIERLVPYFEKALHEAKLHSSWLNPDQEYDQAVATFVRGILADWNSPFVNDLGAFARSIADAGYLNSLAQAVVKICPRACLTFIRGRNSGISIWSIRIIGGRSIFAAGKRPCRGWRPRARKDGPRLAGELLRRWPDERIKMLVIWKALCLRRANIELFRGAYLPLAVTGPRATQVCGFARQVNEQWALSIIPRLALGAWQESPAAPAGSSPATVAWRPGQWWRDTWLQLPAAAPRNWRHAIEGGEFSAEESRAAKGRQAPRWIWPRYLGGFPWLS